MDFIISNLPIVLIALIFFIFIIIILIRRKQLILWHYRSFYGEYSYRYVSQFKSYFNHNPYPHTIKYEAIHFIRTLNNQNNSEITIDKAIDFQELELGKSYPNMLRLKGKPDYFNIQDFDQLNIFVWGYDTRMYNYNTAIHYFFIDSIFIMGQYKFSRENQKINTNELLNKLEEKYLGNNKLTLKENINIKDSKDTKIQLYDDGFSFNICIYNTEIPIVKEKILQTEKNNNKQNEAILVNDIENSDTLVF